MNLAGFRARFPEARTADDDLVNAVLAAAATELNSDEIGAPYDEAHGLLAAHKLALSPFGRMARMLNDEGESTYQVEFHAVMSRAIVAVTTT